MQAGGRVSEESVTRAMHRVHAFRPRELVRVFPLPDGSPAAREGRSWAHRTAAGVVGGPSLKLAASSLLLSGF